MILDALQAAVVTIAGLLLLSAAGVRNPLVRYGLAPLLGIAVLVVVGVGFAVLTLRMLPWAILPLVILLPLALFVGARRARLGTPIEWRRFTAAAVGAAVIGAGCSALARVNYHTDSFEYLTIASQLVQGTFLEAISYFQLERRMFAVGTLHATSISEGNAYSLGATPFLAFALLLAIGVMLWVGLRARSLSPLWAGLVVGIAVGGLAVMNRFVWNAFYVNGHLLFAALLVGIVGLAWLRALNALEATRWGIVGAQSVLLIALVLTRTDAAFTAILAIIPSLVMTSIPRAERGLLLLAIGAPLLAWEGFVILIGRRVGGEITIAMLGLVALAVVLMASTVLLRWSKLFAHPGRILLAVEAAAWAALAVLTLRDPSVLLDSLKAAFANIVLGEGGWGPSIVVLGVVVIATLASIRSAERVHMRFALTTFVPLAFLLAFLRDSPYRIAEADSLNRMVIQIVPLMVVVIAASAIGSWRGRRAVSLVAESGDVAPGQLDDARASSPH